MAEMTPKEGGTFLAIRLNKKHLAVAVSCPNIFDCSNQMCHVLRYLTHFNVIMRRNVEIEPSSHIYFFNLTPIYFQCIAETHCPSFSNTFRGHFFQIGQ